MERSVIMRDIENIEYEIGRVMKVYDCVAQCITYNERKEYDKYLIELLDELYKLDNKLIHNDNS